MDCSNMAGTQTTTGLAYRAYCRAYMAAPGFLRPDFTQDNKDLLLFARKERVACASA